jgi:hypothetical protein
MKTFLGLLAILLITSSCASIEEATAKYKTPDAPNAGLAPGEKSNYLNTSPTPTETKPATTTKKKKKSS